MSKKLEQDLKGKLEELRSKGLYNEIDILEGSNGAEIHIKGKSYINLSSNNYLGLVMHPRMIQAGVEGIQKYGVGAGAVRSINGTLTVHDELEKRLAKFKGTEASIVYQSGFNCNMATIGALAEKEDLILSDELNHASIIDGCKLSPAKVIRVNHSDMTDLRQKAKEARESGLYRRILFITDGVFSMDGDVCLLPEIVSIAKEFDLITYIDDAHGSGVMGKGAGTTKHFGLSKDVDVQMGTLSKAVGVVGGYIAGSQTLIDWLKVKSRPFLFSTALSPTSASACIEALNIMEESTELHDKLWENGNYLKKGLKELGFDIGNSQTPITPCIVGDENLAQTFSRRLMDEGVYAKAIVFPTVPLGTGRVRNMPTAIHTREMMDHVLEVYAKVGRELGLI